MFLIRKLFIQVVLVIFLGVGFSSYIFADNIADYSVLATDSIQFKKKAKILSGFVGVNDHDDHDDDVSLSLGKETRTEEGVRLTSPSILLKKKAVVKGDVFYRDDLTVKSGAIILGNQVIKNNPADWPLVQIPASMECQPDLNNPIIVSKKTEQTLMPGAYGDIRVRKKATLVLEGGTYHAHAIHIGKEAKVILTGAATICVDSHFMTKAKSFFGPDPEDVNTTAGDVQVYVNGVDDYECNEDHSDDDKDKEHHDSHAVKIGKESILFSQVKALNGTIKIKKSVQATGAYIGKDIVVGKGSVITHAATTSTQDTTPPNILSINPPEGSVIDTTAPVISAQFNDDDSGVDAASAIILLDSVDVTAQGNVTSTGFSFTPLPLDNGPHSLSINISDLAGNQAQASVAFTVNIDITPPEIINVLPFDGSILSETAPVLSANFSDADSGIDVASVLIQLDGVDMTGQSSITEIGFSLTPIAALIDGAHTLFISIGDTTGNTTQVSTSFTVDTAPPIISILIPADGSLLATATPQIQGDLNDVHSAVDTASVQILLDGVDLASSATIIQTGFDVTVVSPLLEGIHTLTVAASDTVGNLAQHTITFTTDITPPVINNLVPVNGSTIMTNVPVISGDLSDATAGIDKDSFQIFLNGVDVTLLDTATETHFSFMPTTPLANTSHTVLVRVEDIAGNLFETTFQFNVLVDFIPPVISNIQPIDGSAVNTDTPTISADFTDGMSGINPASAVILLGGSDVTSQANVTVTGFSFVSASLADGSHSLSISVNDANGNNATTQTSFTVDTSAPPVLDPIGDKTIDLGTSLTINLTANDPNNDPLTFTVQPLPLPANASFDTQTGQFEFTPDLEQVRTFPLTFSVSDGVLTDEEAINITVNDVPVGGVTTLTGRLLDTTDFINGVETPVVGAGIALLNTGFSTSTDALGNFTLTGIPGGSQIFDINPATASPAPDGSSYAGFREEMTIINGAANVVERPFFLPRIDGASATQVDPTTTTMVVNPNLGITLEVPAHTAKNPDGTDYTGILSISEVPDGLAPAAMPDNLQPGLLITIQPVGVTFATPVPITFPNIDNLAPGNEVDIWSLDPEAGIFVVVGTGLVTSDGSQIVTISGGVRAADWHMLLATVLGLFESNTNNSENLSQVLCEKVCTGSQTALSTGGLTVQHTLAGYRSLGQTRSMQFVYNSLNADPHPVLDTTTTIFRQSAVPDTISTRLSVGGTQQGIELFTSTAGLNESVDETIRLAVQFDARLLSTGRYPYKLDVLSNYLRSTVGTSLAGNVLVNNQTSSSFGSGWGIAGLSQILIDANGDVFIMEGDGSLKFFNFIDFDEGLAAEWPFNDQVNPTQDVIGNNVGNIDGPIFNTTDFAPVPGNVASLEFDGVDDIVRVLDDDALDIDPSAELSMSLWAKQTSQVTNPFTNRRYFLISKRREPNFQTGFSDGNYQLLRDETNQIHFGSETGIVSSGVDLQLGQWVHLAATYDGANNTILIYMDGVEIARDETYTAGIPNIGVLSIGGFRGNIRTEGYFPGLIDEVKIFNRILTPTEVSRLAGKISTSEGSYKAPKGDFSTLVKNSDGTFVRTLKNGTQINFSTSGLQTSIVDRNGNTTTYVYDINNQLSEITDPSGLKTFLSYANGLLSNITDPASRTTVFNYDADRNLTQIIDPDGTIRQFTYDANHRMIEQTSKRNHVTTYDYNFAGRNIQANRPDGSTRKVSPSKIVGVVDFGSGFGTKVNPSPFVRPEDAVATFTDGNNNAIRTETDRFGAATVTTDALNQTISTVRDANSNPSQVTLPNGVVITLTYDGKGNLINTTDQSITATTVFTYDPNFNQVTSITDSENNATTMTYDANGNPVEIIDAQGTKVVMEYTDTNCSGQVTKIISAQGLPEENSTSFQYDLSSCNLVKTSDPLLNETILTYDTAGNVKTTTDGEGKITQFFYDSMNRLTQVKDASLNSTFYTYDTAGNLIIVQDANNNVTQFAYDEQNRLISTTDPLGKIESFTYDPNGNLIQTTDRNLQMIDFQYDVVNQLVTKTLPGNLATSFTYDTVGNLLTMIDSDSALTMTYDGASRLLSSATTGSPNQPDVTVSYTYDKNSNRKTMIDSVTGTTNYVYDTLNQLTSITNPSAQVVSFGYDTLSRRTSSTLPNGTTTDYAYDTASQLTGLVHKLGATTLSSFGYTYDKIGNRTTMNTVRSGAVVNSSLSYTYDNLYRLTQATNPLPVLPDETFNYDTLGNRLRRDGQTTDATIGNGNQLLEDETFTYIYNNNGNLTQKTEKITRAVTQYTYDTENQLTRIDFPDATFASYKYDGLGRRIEKDVNGNVVRYVYDNEDILLEYDGSNVLQARYTHGVGIDEPLVMERDLDLSGTFEVAEAFYYHTDGLGSVVNLTNNLGNPVHSYVYDSFGNIVQENIGINTGNFYTYTGREFDAESELYYYRTRYYDPVTGRFTQEDPIGFLGDDNNFYSYVMNNPTNRVDPSGLDSFILAQSVHAILAVDDPDVPGGIIAFEFGPDKLGKGIISPTSGIVVERKFGPEKRPFASFEVPGSRIKQSNIEDKLVIERARKLKQAAISGDLKFQLTTSNLNCIGFANGARAIK